MAEGNISFAHPHSFGLFARILDINGYKGTYVQFFFDYFKEPFSVHYTLLNKLAAKESEIRLRIADNSSCSKDPIDLTWFTEIKIKESDGKTVVKFIEWMEKDVFLQILNMLPRIQKAIELCQEGAAYDKKFQLAPPHPEGLFVRNIFKNEEKKWETQIYYNYYKEPILMDQKDFIRILSMDNIIKSSMQECKEYMQGDNLSSYDAIIVDGPRKSFRIRIEYPEYLIRLRVGKRQSYCIDKDIFLQLLDCKSKFMETL